MRPLRFLVLATCLIATITSGFADMFMKSKQEQIRLGLQVAADLRKKNKILPDSDSRVVLLRKISNKLLQSGQDNDPWKWSFDVIESKEVNAFALPGGPTFFYTGLIDKLKTEDQLAGVLGHEMTHVRKQHWAHANAAQQKRQLLLGAILLGTRANNDIANIIGLGDSMVNLQFSRGDESQADQGGFEALTKCGYNPLGMAEVFQMLADEQKGGAPPEFLSDHPSDKHRIDRIQKMIKDSKVEFPPETPLPPLPKSEYKK